MNVTFTCQLIAAKSLLPVTMWDLHPFLPATVPVFQSGESIARDGLLYIPLVRAVNEDQYEFLTGKRCFDVLQALHPGDPIHCRVLPKDLIGEKLLRLLHMEYSLRKGLTSIELAHYMRLCRTCLNDHEQQQLFASLGLQAKPYFIDRTLALLSLEAPLQEGLLAGFISEGIGRELLRLETADREALYTLFLQLNISGGKQKRMLSLLRDLAGRRGISIRECLAERDFQTVINHAAMNTPQKAQVFLQLLQYRHSPSLAEAESRFTAWQNGLSLPSGCTVSHSQAFEQDQVTLSITFADTHQLEKWLTDMRRLLPER